MVPRPHLKISLKLFHIKGVQKDILISAPKYAPFDIKLGGQIRNQATSQSTIFCAGSNPKQGNESGWAVIVTIIPAHLTLESAVTKPSPRCSYHQYSALAARPSA
jgi:hypothetical protein